MRFSQEFIEKVREANDLIDIISEQTALKRTGGQFTGLCPFPSHKEKSPSFSVSQEKQLYHCFGCGKSGNVITFVMETKGLDFLDTVKYLAGRAGIEIPKDRDRHPEEQDEDKSLFHVNKIALEFFCVHLEQLPNGHEVRTYLKSRQLNPIEIEQFKIGYAPREGSSLLKYLEGQRVPIELAVKLGLLKVKDGKTYDAYRHRLMFPIISAQGRVLGFGGRSFTAEQMPKYINSSDSKIFSKGKVLYGLHETAKYIRSEDSAFLVEGYMDLLALFKNGVRNVCAVLGTAFTEDHARLIRKLTKNIYLTFDADNAGQSASMKAIPILLSNGLLPRIVRMDGFKDPDDFFKDHTQDDWAKLVKEAEDLVVWQLKRLAPELPSSMADRNALASKMAETIRLIQVESYRALITEMTALRLQVGKDWLASIVESAKPLSSQNPLKKLNPKTVEKLTETPNPRVLINELRKISLVGAPKHEVMLLQTALLHERSFLKLQADQVVQELNHEGIKKVFEMMNDAYRHMPNKFASLASHLASYVEPSSIIGALFNSEWKNLNEEQLDRLMVDCVRKVHGQQLKNLSKSKLAEMRTSPRNQQLKELEQFMNIQTSLKANSDKNTANE